MFSKKESGNKKVSKGFTLVEIIVVLVILAILAAATIPSLLGFIKDSKYASLDNEASAVRAVAQAYATEHFAKGVSDRDIENAIYGTIKPGHALYSLLQNDVSGTVYEPKVESGRIKGFKYTKAVIDGNEDEDFISDKDVRLTQFDADKSTFIHASERIASINLDDFKEQMKADLLEEITSSLTSDQPSSLKSTLTIGLNSNLESSVETLETSLTTSLNSNLESGMNSKIAALKTNFATELGSLVYPVGSYYVTNDDSENKRPNVLFGGTWERVESKFLYCMPASNAKKPEDSSVALSVGGTGGSATHTHTTGNCTLTIDQIPSHSHLTAYINANARASSGESGWEKVMQARGGTDKNFSSASVGGGQAHNHGATGSTSNIPPYVAVYCWRRTA